MKKTVALIYGGKSREHEVSVNGYRVLKKAIEDTGHEALPVYIDRRGAWHLINDSEPTYPIKSPHGCGLSKGKEIIRIDAAIPLLHGDGGEDGAIQGCLETAGIPYIGADVISSALCIDKAVTKTIARSIGIPTLESVDFSEDTDTEEALLKCENRLGFPIFIKPRKLGSSVGAHSAYTKEEFRRYFTVAMIEGSCSVMVEKLLTDKRELECAFIDLGGRKMISHPGEIICQGTYGYQEKYNLKTHTEVHADISDVIADKIKQYSDILARNVGLRHLGRIDWFLSGEKLYFNEINTFPGMTEDSLYPKLIETMGVALSDAIGSFIEDVSCC